MQPQKITLPLDKLVMLSNIVHSTNLEKLKEFNYLLDQLKSNSASLTAKVDSLNQFTSEDDLNFIKILQFCLQLISTNEKKIFENIKGTITNNTVSLPKGSINTAIITSYITHLSQINNLNLYVAAMLQDMTKIFEQYFATLYKRHSSLGIEIQKNPIATDFANYLFNTKSLQQSIFSNDLILKSISNNINLIEIVIEELVNFWNISKAIQKLFEVEMAQIHNILKEQFVNKSKKDYEINLIVAHIRSLSPQYIQYKKSSGENEEKTAFLNKCYSQIVSKISEKDFNFEIFSQFLNQKKEEYSQFDKKHDFYTCKISSGNQAAGENPGGLELISAPRPVANLDDVKGSGFQEIKEFLGTIKTSSKWSNLFLATSPSKSMDKTNVLLIGPPGCGKTEVLRSVAAQPDSIGIFAQGSDFLTCWKGEAEKNPKRLFELGHQLQVDTGKQVHFLIDEIDSVLKRQELSGPGETNLSLEFQVLMDGVVRYPGLSVWGATNYPERIPPAILRRFSAIKIVGELSLSDRIELLKHFVSFLPTKDFQESSWEEAAKKIEGATGNVIRKIADYIWREKMTKFVHSFPEVADKLSEMLSKDGKFELSQFSSADKEEFKKELSNYVWIDPVSLNDAINSHLDNLAIQSEILLAVNTYANAKKLVSQISK